MVGPQEKNESEIGRKKMSIFSLVKRPAYDEEQTVRHGDNEE
jgi:hypothetical protein